MALDEIQWEHLIQYCIENNVDQQFNCRLLDFLSQNVIKMEYVSHIFISDIRKPLNCTEIKCLIVMDLHSGDRSNYGHFLIPLMNRTESSNLFGLRIEYDTLEEIDETNLILSSWFPENENNDFISIIKPEK